MRLVVLPPRRGSLVSVVMMVEGGRGEKLGMIVTRKHLLERRRVEVTDQFFCWSEILLFSILVILVTNYHTKRLYHSGFYIAHAHTI